MLSKMWGSGNSHALLVGLQSDTVILKDYLVVLGEMKSVPTL